MHKLSTLTVLALVLAATGAPIAIAHSAGSYYDSKYGSAADQPEVWWEGSLTTLAAQRVKNAGATWNALGTRFSFRFSDQTVLGGPDPSCRKTVLFGKLISRVGMAFMDGPGRYSGITVVCSKTGRAVPIGQKGTVAYFVLYFDKGELWNFDPLKKPAGQAKDFLGIATHELGHGTGWGAHYDDQHPTATCPANNPSAVQTMCTGRADPSGFWRRSLGEHDKHTFKAAY